MNTDAFSSLTIVEPAVERALNALVVDHLAADSQISS